MKVSKVLATRGAYRLVHQERNSATWPNVSDLVLERMEEDAMGVVRWTYVTSWCLSAQSANELYSSSSSQAIAAFKMLVNDGPIESVR